MGRVRRYKKFKACDPFAKKKKKQTEEEPGGGRDMDLAPEDADDFEGEAFESVAKASEPNEALLTRRSRAQERRWERELLFDDAYVASLEHKSSSTAKAVTIAPKRTDETAKQFAKRLKEDGKKIMIATAQAQMSSTRKAKEYLQNKKKTKKKAKVDDRSAAEKAADDDDAWRRPEKVAFGTRVDAPPTFTAKPRGTKRRLPGGGGDDDLAPPAEATEAIAKSLKAQAHKRAEKKSLKAAREKMTKAAYGPSTWEAAF